MTKRTRNRIGLIAGGVLVLLILIWGFWPEPVPVQSSRAAVAPLQVAFEEEGITRAEDRYVVSAPVAAFVRRITLEAGDGVRQGEVVAELEAPRAAILDPRTRAEAAARLQATDAALARARLSVEQAVADRDRVRRLAEVGSATGQSVRDAEAAAEQAAAAHEAARAERDAARAALGAGGGRGAPQSVVIAPVAGRVLSVRQESEGHVNPGEPLLEIGDTGRLEVAVDVLSQDAVRINPGSRVLLSQWGGDRELEAVVTRVAPQAFQEVSALGVEERRVTVTANLTSPPEAWARLGAGYRVLARFVVWEADAVLQVPTSALFRLDEEWNVFVIENGRASARRVSIGRQSGIAAQVLAGLAEGDEVIVHPANQISDGTRVTTDES